MGISPQIKKEAAAAIPPVRESPDLLSIGIEQGEFEQAYPQSNGNSLPLILTIHSFVIARPILYQQLLYMVKKQSLRLRKLLQISKLGDSA
jgi:hypothetical protein